MAQCEKFILRLCLSDDDNGESMLIRLQRVKNGSHRCMSNLTSLEKTLKAWHRENQKNELTGKFEGTITEKKFLGKWTKPDGSKSQSVELENINDLSAKAGLSTTQREELFAKIKKYHVVVPTRVPKGLTLATLRAETDYALTYTDGQPNGTQFTLALATEGLGGRIPSDEEGAVEKSIAIKTTLFAETKLEYSEVKGKAEDLFWGWYPLQRLVKTMPTAFYSISATNLSPSDAQTIIESLVLIRSPQLSSQTFPKVKFATASKGKPDEAFIVFYEKFREAIVKKDKNAVASMMRLPFSSDVKSKKDLMKWYDDVFNETIVDAIKTMSEILVEQDGTMLMFHGDFIFSFVKEGGSYKFVGIGAKD